MEDLEPVSGFQAAAAPKTAELLQCKTSWQSWRLLSCGQKPHSLSSPQTSCVKVILLNSTLSHLMTRKPFPASSPKYTATQHGQSWQARPGLSFIKIYKHLQDHRPRKGSHSPSKHKLAPFPKLKPKARGGGCNQRTPQVTKLHPLPPPLQTSKHPRRDSPCSLHLFQ